MPVNAQLTTAPSSALAVPTVMDPVLCQRGLLPLLKGLWLSRGLELGVGWVLCSLMQSKVLRILLLRRICLGVMFIFT